MGKIFSFVKMVGAGNDFIVCDNRRGFLKKNLSALAKRFCDRKWSVGADGLILLEDSKTCDIRMRILNPDGSEAEMCGNGVRCLAKFSHDAKITKSRLSIETMAGVIHAEVNGAIVKAKLVDPKDLKLRFHIKINGRKVEVNSINTGVPHAVQFLSSLNNLDVETLGRAMRQHSIFSPRGTNVDFVRVKSQKNLEIRTYERGVESETLSCGTGSTAAALVAAALHRLTSPVSVLTRSGETLKIYFTKDSRGFKNVYLEGRVKKTFEGRVLL